MSASPHIKERRVQRTQIPTTAPAPRSLAHVRKRLAAGLATIAMALAGLTGLGAHAAQAAGPLTAQFSSTGSGSSWSGTYVVKNGTSSAVNGWTLEFDLPAGVTITSEMYGTSTVSGSHVVVSPAYYNSTVAANGSTYPYSYTFQASGPQTAPTGCLINGDKCDGSPAVPPNAPTGVTVADATAHTVTLSWTAAAKGDFPVASYDVLRGGSVVTSSATTSATVQDLSPATSYQFTVRAKDTRATSGLPVAPSPRRPSTRRPTPSRRPRRAICGPAPSLPAPCSSPGTRPPTTTAWPPTTSTGAPRS